MDFTALIKTVAPWIGTALAGPLGGMALTAAAAALGIPDAGVEAVKQAIGGATPEQMLALKTADQSFAVQMQALGFKQIADMEALAAGDRKDARAMQATAKSGMPALLTILITLGFFGVLGWMLYDKSAVDSPPLLIMLGSLGTGWTAACGFWFGTTAGSQRKDVLLANSAPQGA